MVIAIAKYTYSTYYFIMDKMEGVEVMPYSPTKIRKHFSNWIIEILDHQQT